MKFDCLLIQKHPTLDVYCFSDGSIARPLLKYDSHLDTLHTFGSKCTNGYRKVAIDGKMYSIHRLIAEAFIPNPENKPTVDHKNRCRDDNRVTNLRWATHREQRDNSEQVLGAADYGARSCDDLKTYKTNYMKDYMSRPGYKEHKSEYDRIRYAKLKGMKTCSQQ